jgi:hypothetical protein
VRGHSVRWPKVLGGTAVGSLLAFALWATTGLGRHTEGLLALVVLGGLAARLVYGAAYRPPRPLVASLAVAATLALIAGALQGWRGGHDSAPAEVVAIVAAGLFAAQVLAIAFVALLLSWRR